MFKGIPDAPVCICMCLPFYFADCNVWILFISCLGSSSSLLSMCLYERGRLILSSSLILVLKIFLYTFSFNSCSLFMLFSLYDYFFLVFTCFRLLFIFFLVRKLKARAHFIAHDIYFTVIKMANAHKRLLYFFYQVLYVIVLSNLCKVIWFAWIFLHFALCGIVCVWERMKRANSHSLKGYISFYQRLNDKSTHV